MRARELGIAIGEFPTGPLNAITDVAGVAVGQTTVHWGDSNANLPVGQGPARTGVTAIWPHRDGGVTSIVHNPVGAGFFSLSGTGEMTARTEIEEQGRIYSPILLTNTMSIGTVFDATCRYLVANDPSIADTADVLIPVIAECDDSFLNDARGFHVTREHVEAALESAATGPVEEGCVGAGTGMHLFGYKGGIGTSSRILPQDLGGWTVGVLVLTNFGRRARLTIAGVPVGEILERDARAQSEQSTPSSPLPPATHPALDAQQWREEGSGIVVVATDAPMDGRQLSRVAKRAALGLGRTGSVGGNGSGELLVAFSTTYRPGDSGVATRPILEGGSIDPIFAATIDATEEAVLNALFMATTTDGRLGRVEQAIPIDTVREILRQHGRSV